MPRNDGTGPLRLRLRGSGMSFLRIARATGSRPIGRGLLSLGVPVVAALIHDLRQPDGYLRPLFNRFRKHQPALRVIDADYERVEDGRKKIEEQ
ncbi:MAG TPA: hypothetical protein ENN05_02400 [Deltaproteobacteria bacterium]|nr:hypothetical protein [Deltaproteobacteria bacterium]